MLKKTLFTIVFSFFGLVFYGVFYYALHYLAPDLLVIPPVVEARHVMLALVAFTGIVILAFVGANYIVYGNATGRRGGPGEYR